MLHLARSVLIGWDDGQAGELLPLMTSLAGDFASVATFQAGLALTAALAGDHELARHLLDRVAGSGFSRIRPDVEWLAVRLLLLPCLHGHRGRGARGAAVRRAGHQRGHRGPLWPALGVVGPG